MPTTGEAKFLHQNINSFVALLFVASFALMAGLMMVQVVFGYNPIVNLLLRQTAATNAALRY